ncbi:MAG: hypothetical protein J5829_09140 [Lachnospiraceae bacterium]|nr:hypothetical protein [Lachnospiraceae bacterium]
MLEDPNGEGSYVIKNMLIAIVDDSRITAFNMILSSLIFRGSSYRIFDKINDKRIEIYPEYERPVVCIPGETIDRKTLDEDIIDSLKLEKDEILISGITVFADDKSLSPIHLFPIINQ